ncbi:MAG: TadE/TadG family type IV pilus assembly protein [Roseinatronobacter sp.]
MEQRRAPLHRFFLRHIRADAGNAGIEFALIAPVFLLLLAATLEIGLMMRAQFGLISAVSAAANHSLVLGDGLSEETAVGTAEALARLVAGGGREGTVNVNNAAIAQLSDNGIAIWGSGAGASNCFCPIRTNGAITWGTAVQCGTACNDSSMAGQFVEITAQASFTPILGIVGLFRDDLLRNSAVVRLP